MALCDICLEGTYQAGSGETACVSCPKGSFCAEGSSAEFAHAVGLENTCTRVLPDQFWTANEHGVMGGVELGFM